MFGWLRQRRRRQAEAHAAYEADCQARIEASGELDRLGWRSWEFTPPYGYDGLIETVRLEEFQRGAWKHVHVRVRDVPGWCNVVDLWWRPVRGDAFEHQAPVAVPIGNMSGAQKAHYDRLLAESFKPLSPR